MSSPVERDKSLTLRSKNPRNAIRLAFWDTAIASWSPFLIGMVLKSSEVFASKNFIVELLSLSSAATIELPAMAVTALKEVEEYFSGVSLVMISIRFLPVSILLN